MNEQQRKAMKLALEALELCNGGKTVNGWRIDTDQEIAAIKETLAQQEPDWDAVGEAHLVSLKRDTRRTFEDAAVRATHKVMAELEQKPVAWMTINAYGEEDDIHYENPEGHLLEGWTYKPLYTHAPTVQPEKEPLEYWNAVEGWVKIDEVRKHFDSVGCGTIYKTAGEDRVPLYTTPPQRKPLTDEQIVSVAYDCNALPEVITDQTLIAFVRAIEAVYGIKE